MKLATFIGAGFWFYFILLGQYFNFLHIIKFASDLSPVLFVIKFLNKYLITLFYLDFSPTYLQTFFEI